MKKKILMLVMSFVFILPVAFLLSACCGGGKNYSVSMTIDGQYMYLDMFGFGDISFKKDDLKNSGLNLCGYDVYDYSELTVLFNGKENNEWFSKQDNSGSMYSNQIRGKTIVIGTFMPAKINEDVKITIRGAVKEKEVSFAFMRADDERLGENKLEPTNQAIFDRNYNDYIENYSTKLKEKDYQYFDTHYKAEDIASSTSNGYTSVDWLFKDDKNVILHEDENEEKTIYKPYEFKYNASEFFNKYLVTYYAYIEPNGAMSGGYDSSQLENLPSGTKEYKYQAYVFRNGDFYDRYAVFEILSDEKYGYYDGVEIRNYEYNFGNYGSDEGILDNYYKIVVDPYKPLNKDNITVEQLRKQSNYVFELYEKNLFVFDFSNMNVKEKNILINYSDGQNICSIDASLSSDYGDGHFDSDGNQLADIGKVDTESTFYIINLPNKEGVSGIDFSNAEIYINGTKLEKLEGALGGYKLGGYKYVPANAETGVEEYFECYINAGVVEIDFYSKERLLDNDLSLDHDKEEFVITIKNINFDSAEGLSKIKVIDSTQSNLPSITSGTYDDTFLNTVYSWNEGNTVYAYVQTGDNKPNKILVSFTPFGGLDITKTPKVSINKGGDIKKIDIMAQINKGLGDPSSLQDFSDVLDEIDNEITHRHISWSEDGYKIQVSFYQSEIDIQYLSTINIQLQLDGTTDWLEMNCEFI